MFNNTAKDDSSSAVSETGALDWIYTSSKLVSWDTITVVKNISP